MSELAVLQAVRLKGRVTLVDLATTLGENPASIAQTVEALTASGLLLTGETLRLSDAGRTRLGEMLAEERKAVDAAALAAAYRAFRPVNADFKALVTDWQLKAGTPNTHDDIGYDAAVLARLDNVHQRVVPIIAAAAAQLPRLSGYTAKLQRALDHIKAGRTAWLTHPMIDSYHTVWFELHEELILAAGLTREGEASAGHAY
ncbi:MarR family transcriptional regulator [Mycobacterium sp. SM1]|uniref:MarR family transcriptional regulator n=1 Tax=Mycobacterium sp. SM1 TaxID=2816243 RepID=UPI001BCD9F79|nr:MarR family transcriptional regulator [Mycobacterium sp. SM1]MBS4727106.1 MarR family transcriptional regulator [Mycobacterium sp. SM1]